MKKKIPCRLSSAAPFAHTISLAIVVLFFSSCNNQPTTPTTFAYDTTVKNWINWNVRISEQVDPSVKIAEITKFFIDSIDYFDEGLKGLKLTDPSLVFTLNFRLDSCSCDKFLYNMRGDLQIQGSGNSAGTIPPPTYPPIKPGGGLAIIDDNDTLNHREHMDTLKLSGKRVQINVKEVDTSKLLAVIDSGIDSSLFSSQGLLQILWKGAGLNPTQRNFSGIGNLSSFSDNDSFRHGSAVTSIALEAFKGKYPQLMILKILDANGATSIFAASCALKYAILHNANVINASWGYYGRRDSVLESYVDDARRHAPSALIIAAAGNDTLTHNPNDLCLNGTITGRNTHLGEANYLYYPACFSKKEGSNVISVTGLNGARTTCVYQNYSDEYVSVGVQNDDRGNRAHPCCSFHIGYLDNQQVMEGSSFATPVIAGKISDFILRHGTKPIPLYFSGIGVMRDNTVGAKRNTVNNQYLVY